MSVPPTVTVRRKTGAQRCIAFGEDSNTEFDWGEGAQYMKNAYSVTREFGREEIDVTSFGDYPFKATEAGFINAGINISMRKGTTEDGALAPDVEFMESHALSGEPFRIAVLDDRGTTPNGLSMTVVATQANDGGDVSAAQDLSYTLKVASGRRPPMRIVKGVPVPIVAK